jgi:hypothetical protein
MSDMPLTGNQHSEYRRGFRDGLDHYNDDGCLGADWVEQYQTIYDESLSYLLGYYAGMREAVADWARRETAIIASALDSIAHGDIDWLLDDIDDEKRERGW